MNWHTFVEALTDTEREVLASALHIKRQAIMQEELTGHYLTPEEMSQVAINHVTAIKMVRDRTGWELMKSKMLVDRFMRGQP